MPAISNGGVDLKPPLCELHPHISADEIAS
jgi:hypothetical protein